MSRTWRERIHARVAELIRSAREEGLDEKATRRALVNPYRDSGPSWPCQVWYDEVSRQLGKTTGRIKRSNSPLAVRERAEAGGQLPLEVRR